MNQDEKLDEALKGTFPASDAFYLAPEKGDLRVDCEADPEPTPA